MNEVSFVTGEADAGLRDRLDEEITECGRTPGYPHGHDHIHLVKQFR